jgi:hypothetical protein
MYLRIKKTSFKYIGKKVLGVRLIRKLLIFEKTGICLFSKDYSLSSMFEDDDLITGFLSVLYGFLDVKFGNLVCITTRENTLLIKTLQDIYITLIIERIEQNAEGMENDRSTLLNKRIENACKAQLGLIERKVRTMLLKLQIRKENDVNYRDIFSKFESDFDEIITHGLRKIKLVKKVFENNPINGALEIYKA